MARLTNEQAAAILTTPKNGDFLKKARKHEERLLFHTEPLLEDADLPQAKNVFLEWVRSFLPADKFLRFSQLVQLPVETVDTTEKIFDDLGKVFEAQDRYIKFDFVSDGIREDFTKYSAQIGDPEFWQDEGFDALKNSICSLVVIDLPVSQTTSRPEPYYYILHTKDIIDVDFSKKGAVEYAAFYQPGQSKDTRRAIVIDDEFYRTYERSQYDDWKLIAIAQHSYYGATGALTDGLGYAPVCSFYDAPLKKSNGVNKKGPLTASLGKLDWLLFMKTSKKYLDLYGTWPIIVTYKEACTYRDEDTGAECSNGFLYWETDTIKPDGSAGLLTNKKKCPACESRSLIGPGSFWSVDPPRDSDDVDLMKNPISIVEISNDKLTFAVSEIERLDQEIYRNCVGWDGEAIEKEAVNEDQVKANFEGRQAILESIKKYIEKTHKFAMDTVARLRYGAYFIGSVVDYGNEYFLKSESDLINEITEQNSAGLPLYIIAQTRDQLNRTRNKNNPEQLNRNSILSQLEPYPDLSITQINQFNIKYSDPVGYVIKVNFSNFIARFEREQMNIVEFASLLPLSKKIDIINKKLSDYANERNTDSGTWVDPRAATGSSL